MSALQLPAVTALEQAPDVLRRIDAAMVGAAAGPFDVDASALTEFDTSAIALLLHAQREASRRGLVMQVRGVPPKLRELAKLYGVEALLPLGAEPTAAPVPTAT